MFSLQQTCARAASFKLASTSSTKRRATTLKAVVEPKENGSIDEEEEKVSSVADAVQSAEKAFEMADATPAVETSSPKAMQAMIDPADGSVAEAAPLGNDTQLLDDAMKVFSNATAIEMINGRVAQIGWMAALYTEITQNKSLWGQVFSTRTFTLADGVSDTVTYPGAGLFLAPFCGIFILAASLAPVLKKSSPDGVTAPGNALGPFKPEAELTNGRGAMVGLVALLLAEKFTNGNPLF
jgi:hypothetical protein